MSAWIGNQVESREILKSMRNSLTLPAEAIKLFTHDDVDLAKVLKFLINLIKMSG